jgi:hypothetical protein
VKQTEEEYSSLDPLEGIQILFLRNDKDSSVEAIETNNLPCSEIMEHLNRGESVFISNKSFNQEKDIHQKPANNPSEIWYLKRF